MAFFFAWVNSSESTFTSDHARLDEDMFAFSVSHGEGDFAIATVLIRNPRVGLLAPGRKTWVWISTDALDTGGFQPLFFGRLVGVPTELQDEVFRITVRARPRDMNDQKTALAATLRVAPYYDPVWIAPERRADPDSILESRTVRWHYDRISHAVTVSDIVNGEDGTLALGGDDFFADSLSFSLGEQPLRAVSVEATVNWRQQATGLIDVSKKLIAGDQESSTFVSTDFTIDSYTGQGLADDWPSEGDDIGGGWTVGPTTLTRVDGLVQPVGYLAVQCSQLRAPEPDEEAEPPQPVTVRFRRWQFIPSMQCRYDADRAKSETVRFTLTADVQPLYTDDPDDEAEVMALSSNEIGEPIDEEGTDNVRPIGDFKRRQYFTTERGRRSIEALICFARARLIARARAVQIAFDVTLELAASLNCRKNITISSPLIPGGTATGKVISYSFGVTENGEHVGSVVIACSVGRGATVASSEGEPVYVEDDYVEADYQQYAGERVVPIPDEVYYVPPADAVIDDGIDFQDMTADNNVTSVTITNGRSVQADLMARPFIDVSEATTTLNDAHTEIALVLRPVTGGPFPQTYYVEISDMMIPKTIDLEAA